MGVKRLITCFDIGGSFIRFGRPGPDGIVAEAGRLPTPKQSWHEFVAAIRLVTTRDNAGVASISLAGVFDDRTGLARVANLPCLDGRHVAQELSSALSIPVLITNDADCFALAEAHQGSGRGCAVVFGIILGSGVGGGIVIDGKLLRGYGGFAGEWGHGPIIDPTAGGRVQGLPGFVCGCGHTGCIDAVCSARGMERLHTALHAEEITSTQITGRWKQGEARACATIELYCEHLARALSVMINTLGPDVVPVSGGLAQETKLIARLDTRVRELVLAEYTSALVMPGVHAGDGGLVGAGIAALQALESGQLAK